MNEEPLLSVANSNMQSETKYTISFHRSCLVPCSIVQQSVVKRQVTFGGVPDTLTNVYINLKSTDIEVHADALLFDFNAILASVGGSMGLFLGFSFLDCFMNVGTKVKSWIGARNAIDKK